MRIFFTFVILLSFLFGKATDGLPDDFMLSFNAFKKARIKKDVNALYDLQVPYFKYLNSYGDYKHYVKSIAVAENAVIAKVFTNSAENVEILLGLKLKNRKSMLYYKQSWYKVNDRFLLLTKEKLLFKY